MQLRRSLLDISPPNNNNEQGGEHNNNRQQQPEDSSQTGSVSVGQQRGGSDPPANKEAENNGGGGGEGGGAVEESNSNNGNSDMVATSDALRDELPQPQQPPPQQEEQQQERDRTWDGSGAAGGEENAATAKPIVHENHDVPPPDLDAESVVSLVPTDSPAAAETEATEDGQDNASDGADTNHAPDSTENADSFGDSNSSGGGGDGNNSSGNPTMIGEADSTYASEVPGSIATAEDPVTANSGAVVEGAAPTYEQQQQQYQQERYRRALGLRISGIVLLVLSLLGYFALIVLASKRRKRKQHKLQIALLDIERIATHDSESSASNDVLQEKEGGDIPDIETPPDPKTIPTKEGEEGYASDLEDTHHHSNMSRVVDNENENENQPCKDQQNGVYEEDVIEVDEQYELPEDGDVDTTKVRKKITDAPGAFIGAYWSSPLSAGSSSEDEEEEGEEEGEADVVVTSFESFQQQNQRKQQQQAQGR